MTYDANDLIGTVHLFHESRHCSVSPKLVRSPATRDEEAEQIGPLERIDSHRRRDLQPMLAANRVQVQSSAHHVDSFFLESHHRREVLEILNPFGDEYRDAFSG